MAKKVSELMEQAAKYDHLASVFKYMDPNQHVYYYFKHLEKINMALHLINEFHHTNTGKLRIFLATPDLTKIDVYLNNKKLVMDGGYLNASGCFDLSPGKYQIDIRSTEKTSKKLASGTTTVHAGLLTTTVLAQNLGFYSYYDDYRVPQGESKIRFLHLSEDMPTIDIAVKNRDIVFPNLSYLQISEYLGITPMTIDLEVRIAGTKTILYSMPKTKFLADKGYTIALTGLLKEKLEVIFLKEDE